MCELFHDVFWYGEVNVSFVLIPFEVYTAVEVTGAVFNNVISFSAEGVVEMLQVVFANILDPKVVHHKVEPYLTRCVLP
jgi:hypothetical protein